MKYKAEIFFFILFLIIIFIYFNTEYFLKITKINFLIKNVVIIFSLLLIACPNIKEFID